MVDYDGEAPRYDATRGGVLVTTVAKNDAAFTGVYQLVAPRKATAAR